ncbi:uL15 family ribosomal protein [Candidatus Woesearchaeota archaeon]|nr:uL15 family ribosomal protein [Candidatus Woesearchaeota archaeon]
MIKRTKNSRQRGSHTHGWGAKKKHRGAGHRGGRGRAGSGKRGDAKKPRYWSTEKPGKIGFNSKTSSMRSISIVYIENHIKTLSLDGAVSLSGKECIIDLKKMKYDKLLGNGLPSRKYYITVASASEHAVDKIESAGGKVFVDEPAVPKQKEAADAEE